MAARVFVGLGANLGDTRAALRAAVEAMKAWSTDGQIQVSSFYATQPVDAQGPYYLNAVAAWVTEHSAEGVLDGLQRIEAAHGRERPYPNAPRTLDLDLLLYGDAHVDLPRLKVPHPRLHQRAFVLAPLAELAPGLSVPGHGPVEDLLDAVRDQRIDKLERP